MKRKILLYGRGLQANFYIDRIIEKKKFDVENIKTYKNIKLNKEKKNIYAAVVASSTKNQSISLQFNPFLEYSSACCFEKEPRRILSFFSK